MTAYRAAILAGGKSDRVGRDKAMLRIENKFLLDLIYAQVSEVIDDIRIIGDKRPDSLINPSMFVSDLIPDLGPMGGLYTALTILQAPLLLISCDMPMIRSEHLHYLLQHDDKSYQAVVAVGPDGIEPLFAIYQPTSLPLLETSIKSGDYALYKFINKLKVKFVDFSKTNKNTYLFFNINTFSDYKKVLYLKKQNQD